MISLDFLSLGYLDYRSFIRVDAFDRFCLVVADQHVLLCMTKDSEPKQFAGGLFEKVQDEVIWRRKCENYFHSIYSYRFKDKEIRDIKDVAVDMSNLYFLVREQQ